MTQRTRRLAAEVLRQMNFPILENTPAVAIDFDDTLAVYDGWESSSDVVLRRLVFGCVES